MMMAEYYQSLFLIFIFILSISYSSYIQINRPYLNKKNIKSTDSSMMILMFIVIIFIGTRPNHPIFADMMGYVYGYNAEMLNPSSWSDIFYSDDKRNEWLWQFIYMVCARLGMPSWMWLTIVAAGYIGIGALAIKRLFKSQSRYIAFLFFISAFSFFSYAVNGMRNGLSFSFVLLAFTYLNKNARDLCIFALLSFIAYNIHHTALLPLLCALISLYLNKKSKIPYYFWLLSIPLSLLAHGFFESLLINLSPDERLADNLSTQYGGIGSGASSSGFRWDFLLYSIMPILLGRYVLKRNNDATLSLLLNTYLLCNSFWILVIRASFSNRFAYLSWFMYPILLAYPLLEIHFTKNQHKWLYYIMMAHLGFTMLMHFIYYA